MGTYHPVIMDNAFLRGSYIKGVKAAVGALIDWEQTGIPIKAATWREACPYRRKAFVARKVWAEGFEDIVVIVSDPDNFGFDGSMERIVAAKMQEMANKAVLTYAEIMENENSGKS